MKEREFDKIHILAESTLDEAMRKISEDLEKVRDEDKKAIEKGAKTMTLDYNLFAQHTNKLKEIIDAIGWPTISKVGEKAAEGAFYAVQHSGFPIYEKEITQLVKDSMSVEEAMGKIPANPMIKLRGTLELDFMKRCLSLMKKANETNNREVNPKHIEFLEKRIFFAEGDVSREQLEEVRRGVEEVVRDYFAAKQ